MTKRPTKRELDEDEIERLSIEHAGMGHGPRPPSDYVWEKWGALPPEYLHLLYRIDHTKEPRLLLPLLNVPPEVRPHFVDLFERLEFKRRIKKTPSYMLTEHQQRLLAAKSAVKDLGWRTDKAARFYGVERTSLETALRPGAHSSLRRGIK